MGYRQDAPNAIQIEATQGCNLRCAFCGIAGIQARGDHNYQFMSIATAASLAARLADAREQGWNPRVEWAMHGEPTLNEGLAEHLYFFRLHNPRTQLMLTTNGVPLQQRGKKRRPDDPQEGFDAEMRALFRNGLTVFALDNYKGLTVAPMAREFGRRYQVPVYDYPDQPEGNPHKRRNVKDRVIVIIRDISDTSKGTHSELGNHAGAGAPLDFRKVNARCAKPFRELSIRWDGNVAICCNDWRGEFKVGNAVDAPLDVIWQHPRLMAARKLLLDGARRFRPCYGCNHTSYRVGLLPDRMGKAVMPGYVEEVDGQHINEALAGPPFTQPVPRPWE